MADSLGTSGVLAPFGPDIWIAEGPTVVAALGFRYPTRMAVMRLSDGGLFVWSPVALTDSLRAAVDALDPVRVLVAPNALHDSFVGEWMAAYPDASAYAAPGLAAKRKDIAFAGDLGDEPAPAWAADIDQVVVRNAIATEIVFFHRASGTAIFTDLIQQLPTGWYSGWRALVAKLDLMTAPEPSVPRKFRMALSDKRAARAAVQRILAWPIRKLLMAHGTPVAQNGAAAVVNAFRWLVR